MQARVDKGRREGSHGGDGIGQENNLRGEWGGDMTGILRQCRIKSRIEHFSVLQILQGAAQTVAEQIYEFSTDRFGSHVARSLIGLAAGIELQSLQGSNTGQPVKAHNVRASTYCQVIKRAFKELLTQPPQSRADRPGPFLSAGFPLLAYAFQDSHSTCCSGIQLHGVVCLSIYLAYKPVKIVPDCEATSTCL